MIIVDSALQKRQDADNPVRVGLIGSGFAGQGYATEAAQLLIEHALANDLVRRVRAHTLPEASASLCVLQCQSIHGQVPSRSRRMFVWFSSEIWRSRRPSS